MVRVPDAAAQVRSAPVKALRGFFGGIGQLLITADRFRAEGTQGEPAFHGKGRRGQRGQTARKSTDHDKNYEEDRDEPLTAPRDAVAARRGRDSRAGRHRATSSPGPAASAQNPTRRFRSLDSTGNVRLLTSDDADAVSDDARYHPVREDAAREDAVAGHGLLGDAVFDDAVFDDTVPEQVVPVYGELPVAAVPATALPPPIIPPAAAALSAADLPIPGYDQLTLASLRSRLRYLDTVQLTMLTQYERATANRSEVVGMFERRIAKLQAASGRAT
jgi:hypothetical protein